MGDVMPEKQDQEELPCGWKFLAICYLLPISIGGLNGCHWAAATFHFQANGWDLAHIAAVTFAGFICRPLVTRSLVALGMWMALPIAILHLLCAAMGLLFPFREWALLAQIFAVICLDIYVAAETLAFMTFGDTEHKAKVACGAVTQMTVVSYACSSSIGGVLFDLGGWRGLSIYHVAMQAVQILLLATTLQDELRQCCGKIAGKAAAEDSAAEAANAPPEIQESRNTLAPPTPARGRADTGGSTNSKDSGQSRLTVSSLASRKDMNAAGAMEMRAAIRGRRASLASCTCLVDELVLMPAPEAAVPEGPEESKGRREPLPKDLYGPALLAALISFANFYTYQSEWSTYALYFKDVHGWTQATWSGLAQTAGDVLAAVVMKVQNCVCQRSLDDEGQYARGGSSWLLASVLGKPYQLSVLCLAYVTVCFGMTSTSLVVAMTSQVLMGSVFVVLYQAVTSMNTFYSLGDSNVFLKLQVLKQNAEALASALAGLTSLMIYQQVGPTAPFFLTGCLFVAVFFIYTAGFCMRVGFGKSLESAEAARSRRMGTVRRITWNKGQSQENLADQTAPDLQINVIAPEDDEFSI